MLNTLEKTPLNSALVMKHAENHNMKSTVPPLSSNDIELKAEETIELFNEDLLAKPQTIPILDFAERTKRQFGIVFRYDMDLGQNNSGQKIIGLFRPKPRAIFIDISVKNTNRFPFLLAHEYGHLVLHSHVDPIKSGYSDPQIKDTEYDLITGKKVLRTPKDWIEWQANRFASALLMPRSTFIDALISYQQSIGIRKNLGIIFLENKNYSVSDFKRILNYLSTLYSVNKTNIEYRLNDLGILVDQRLKDVRHISELLKEE